MRGAARIFHRPVHADPHFAQPIAAHSGHAQHIGLQPLVRGGEGGGELRHRQCLAPRQRPHVGIAQRLVEGARQVEIQLRPGRHAGAMLGPFMLDQLHRRRGAQIVAHHVARHQVGRSAILRPLLADAVWPQAVQGKAELAVAPPALQAAAIPRGRTILRRPADRQRVAADRQHALGFLGGRPFGLGPGQGGGHPALRRLGQRRRWREHEQQGKDQPRHSRNPVRCRPPAPTGSAARR